VDINGARLHLHDLTGDNLGPAHVPWPLELGDLVALEHDEFRVVVVETGHMFPLAAVVKVRPAHLRLVPL
jgi:hypothetical protein